MKRIRTIIFSIILTLGFVFMIAGCKKKTKLPTTDYEKVKYAFNGVEKSFKKPKTLDNSNDDLLKLLSFNPTQNDLNSIKNIYTTGDNQGDVIDELEYYAPPMIQFQCLKKVLEKIGEDYSFGTKYYDQIDGTAYIDLETGTDKSKESNKESYALTYEFILSIDIIINDNNLINADVSFDITATQNNKNYHTLWYVSLILDYDMEESSPNYTLTMLTNNDEKEVVYRNGYTYEYDYVEVVDSKIKEWRKFCFESSEKLVKDSMHTSFDDYANIDGIEYDSGTCKWYYNNELHKITKKNAIKNKQVADIYYRIGLNSTDLDGTNFINKQGTKNSVIKTIYTEFSDLFKKDIIYSLLVDGEHDNHGGEDNITGIRIMNDDATGGLGNIWVNDQPIGYLITNFVDTDGNAYKPQVYYVDQNGGLSALADINRLNYYVAIYNDSGELCEPVLVTSGNTISQCYAKAYQEYNITSFFPSFKLILKDDDLGVSGETFYNFEGGSAPETGDDKFPEEAKSYGIPVFDGNDFTRYILENNTTNNGKLVKVIKATDAEANDYFTTITKAGFERTSQVGNVYEYVKATSDTQKIHLRYDITNPGEIRIEAWYETVTPVDPGDDPVDPGDEPIVYTQFALVGSFNNWSTTENAIYFLPQDGNTFFINELELDAEVKFKIVGNGEYWFDYDDVKNAALYSKIIDYVDDAHNILIKQNCKISMFIEIDNGSVKISFTDVTATDMA
ncbi:MAG: hypothetical protein J6Y28_09340 [Acholeplasmatales bacterium]|nr:hypothetical protein [Acholeplasmatales bacterium]